MRGGVRLWGRKEERERERENKKKRNSAKMIDEKRGKRAQGS